MISPLDRYTFKSNKARRVIISPRNSKFVNIIFPLLGLVFDCSRVTENVLLPFFALFSFWRETSFLVSPLLTNTL